MSRATKTAVVVTLAALLVWFRRAEMISVLNLIQNELMQVCPKTPNPAGNHPMNYPLLPADAAAYAWQLSCCVVTLLFAMLSWMFGPR